MVILHKTEKQKNFFGYAILLLFVFIFSGIVVVEVQLNDLTRESDFAKVLNIKRNRDTQEVVVYFMGETNDIGKVDYLKVDLNESEIIVMVADDRNIKFPYKKWYLEGINVVDNLKEKAKQYYAEFF